MFGQLLIRMGVVSAAQLDEALSEQEKIGKRVGQILLHKRYITRADITKALSIQLGISNIAPNVYTVDPSLLSKATPEYFRKHRVVPLSRVVTSCGRGREIVTVLMEDPLDMVTIAELEKAFGGEIQPTVSTTIGIEDFLNEVFDAWGRYRVVNETTLRKGRWFAYDDKMSAWDKNPSHSFRASLMGDPGPIYCQRLTRDTVLWWHLVAPATINSRPAQTMVASPAI